jgi:methylase of polypeptide subunit release factors
MLFLLFAFFDTEELERRKISKGKILDLGTGPTTQAIQLAKRGLQVTGSDVSEAAII